MAEMHSGDTGGIHGALGGLEDVKKSTQSIGYLGRRSAIV